MNDSCTEPATKRLSHAMAEKKKAAKRAANTKPLEQTLWEAADKMRSDLEVVTAQPDNDPNYSRERAIELVLEKAELLAQKAA